MKAKRWLGQTGHPAAFWGAGGVSPPHWPSSDSLPQDTPWPRPADPQGPQDRVSLLWEPAFHSLFSCLMNTSPFSLIRWNKQLEPEFLFPRKSTRPDTVNMSLIIILRQRSTLGSGRREAVRGPN